MRALDDFLSGRVRSTIRCALSESANEDGMELEQRKRDTSIKSGSGRTLLWAVIQAAGHGVGLV